jgi:demethylmenaquinone methyltransferase/2-methoxy-6-polyprenyl-1,4-benzoquinol methylase
LADEKILRDQIAYYRARAREYDQWFLRQGRYDRGPRLNARWGEQVRQVREALDRFAPAGEVLELACGTGLWTGQLLARADRVTVLDAAPEMLDIHRERIGPGRVEYVQADLFAWRPPRRFDVVFFAFWLSHVPHSRFEALWETVAAALKPGGRVFFVDSLYSETSGAPDHRRRPDAATALRRLNDGTEHRIVKIFHDPQALEGRLRDLGWDVAVRRTPDYFLYASGARARPRP